MPVSEFPNLLARHMRRIRASAAGVASEIGMSREAVNNWRNGDSLPNRRHREKVLACARYLRLSEAETNELLAAVAFEAEYPVDLPQATLVSPAIAPIFEQLQQLRPYPILMLLTPAHIGQPPEREAMLDVARSRYGVDNVLHLQPPFSLSSDSASYFAAIAAQCGLPDIDSDYAFEAALARRLKAGGQLFCLVSRFEQGDPAQREVLAGILRSLSEMHSGRLHLLICGGAGLADLKYQGGDLSLLNIATSTGWPELSADDLRRMAQRRAISGIDGERALRLSGGHPLLADAAISLLHGNAARDDVALVELLAAHEPLWQSLLPLLVDSRSRSALRPLLQRPRLGPARPYLLDPLLRDLYWANLIAARKHADGSWLEWRCAAICRAAEQIIQQLDAPA